MRWVGFLSADKAQFSRPQDLFGQFGLQHHVGKSHPHLMGTGKFVGTTDSERPPLPALLPFSLSPSSLQSRLNQLPWSPGSNHPDGLHLPRNRAGLPSLPAGMLNLTAKAGDVLMIPVRCTTFRPLLCSRFSSGFYG